jgi:hypothetical protein
MWKWSDHNPGSEVLYKLVSVFTEYQLNLGLCIYSLPDVTHELDDAVSNQTQEAEKLKFPHPVFLIKHHGIKICGGVEVYSHAFLTSGQDEFELTAPPSSRFNSRGKRHHTHCIGGQLCARAGLDTMKKRESVAPVGNRIPIPRTSIP